MRGTLIWNNSLSPIDWSMIHPNLSSLDLGSFTSTQKLIWLELTIIRLCNSNQCSPTPLPLRRCYDHSPNIWPMCGNPNVNLSSSCSCMPCEAGPQVSYASPPRSYIHPSTHLFAIYPTVIHPCPSFLRKCTTNSTSTLMPIHPPSIQNASTHALSFLHKYTAKSTSTLIHPFVKNPSTIHPSMASV